MRNQIGKGFWFTSMVVFALCFGQGQALAGDYLYETNNGTITITRYTGPGGAVDIPSEIDGLPVTSIGGDVFRGCNSLTSVTIPDTVTNIEDAPPSPTILMGAFSYCCNLTDVVIGNGITNIGIGAFYGCTSLTSVNIPNSVNSIGARAFETCNSLTSVLIGDSVASIGNAAFGGCTNLTMIIIPNSVTNIGGYAFHYCTGLTNVVIGTRVASIELGAFLSTGLTSVTIPAGVSSIGDWAFGACNRLAAVIVDPLNGYYSSLDGVLFNKAQTVLIGWPGGRIGSYVIPNSVTSIGRAAFAVCTGLTSVTIPTGVTSIGQQAFETCSSLTGAYFNGNAPEYDETPWANLFYNATNVTIYYLPGTVGWGSTFGGRPTAPWVLPHPVILTNAPRFGIQDNAFNFRISWATNVPVVVEASQSLTAPNWSAISTNTLTDGWTDFCDPQWTKHSSRFYRVRSP